MMVYLLYHKRLLEDDVYERKIIGIYSSYEMAASRIIVNGRPSVPTTTLVFLIN